MVYVPSVLDFNNMDLGVSFFQAGDELNFLNPSMSDVWPGFRDDVVLSSGSYFPASMVLKQWWLNETSSVETFSAQCTDIESISIVWFAIMTSENVSLLCDGLTWKVQFCNGPDKWRVCTNCSNPCNDIISSQVSSVPVNASVLTNPYAGYFGFTLLRSSQQQPTYSYQCASVTESSVEVHVNSSGFGYIYCAALADVDTPLLSSSPIYASGKQVQVLSGSHSRSEVVVIDDLEPNTAYRIVCGSESLVSKAATSSLDDFNRINSISCLSKNCRIITPGNVTVTVRGDNSMIVVNHTSSPLVVTLPNVLLSDLELTPVIHYAPFSNTAGCDGSSVLEWTEDRHVAIPSTLRFLKSDAIRSQFFVLKTRREGCYLISFNISGYYGKNVKMSVFPKSTFPGNILLLSAYSDQSYFGQPTISEVTLTAGGSRMLVKYKQRTDKGELFGFHNKSFACNEILSFAMSNLSSCVFISEKVLQVTFPSASLINGDRLPSPGEEIIIKGGKIRLECPESLNCDIRLFQNSSRHLVTISDDIPRVHPVISSVNEIAKYSSSQLDVSSSHGHGGRRWASVKWRVFHPNMSIYYNLENYVNSNMSWFHCIPGTVHCDVVPGHFFYEPGLYTFVLELTNFMGIVGSVSHSWLVRDNVYVSVKLTGAKMRILSPHETINTLALVSISSALPAESNVEYHWSIYRDGSVFIGVENVANVDRRRFTTTPYAFQAGHEYRIRVKVRVNGLYISVDEITLHIVGEKVMALITGAEIRSISYSSAVTLDASQSYDGETGSGSDLYFQWTCVKIDVGSNGKCNAFDLLDQSIRNSSILSVATVFDYSSTYMMTVHILGSRGRVAVATTTLIIGGASDTLPEVQLSYIDNRRIDVSSPHNFDAMISSGHQYSARWFVKSPSIYGLQFKNFSMVGSSTFPYQSQPFSFIPLLQYTLVLEVAPSCENCVPSLSEILVIFNEPPRSGSFLCSPSSGDDNTTFMLAAFDWLDDDMPIFYSFQRNNMDSTWSLLIDVSELSYGTVTLGAGRMAGTLPVNLVAVVADSLGSFSRESTDVLVAPSKNMTDRIANVVFDITVGRARKNSDIMLQTSSFIYSVLNSTSVDCTLHEEFCTNMTTTKLEVLGHLLIMSELSIDIVSTLSVDMCQITKHFSTYDKKELEMLTTFATDLAHGIVATQFNGKASTEVVSKYFYCANDVLEMFEAVNITTDDMGATIVDNSILVAQKLYDVLVVGQSIDEFVGLSLLGIELSKNWPDDESLKFGTDTNYGTLQTNRVPYHRSWNTTSAVGYVVVASRLRYHKCYGSNWACRKISGELFAEYFSSEVSTVSGDKSASNGYYSLQIDDELYHTYRNTRVVKYNYSCSGNAAINVSCSEVDTGGYAYEGSVDCLSLDSSVVIELTCPSYVILPHCTSQSNRSFSYPSTYNTSSGVFFCDVPVTLEVDRNDKLPSVPGYSVYEYRDVVSALHSYEFMSNASFRVITPPPTPSPTSGVKSRSFGVGSQQYTTFPATSVLLGILFFSAFSLAIWFSLASRSPAPAPSKI